jgi:hypothetical protein
MDPTPIRSATAFQGSRRLASGPLPAVALAVKAALEREDAPPILTFDDATGAVIDLDLRGTAAEVVARLAPPPEVGAAPRGRGRPKLGVVAREVTLLPRHWDWLAAQPGGASVALRRLVEEARQANRGRERRREAQTAAYRFMTAMAGDAPGFEAALRALFAGDAAGFEAAVRPWPADLREHARCLAASALDPLDQGTSHD